MSLPNLSQLRVADTGVKLFEYLIANHSNKGDDCTRHMDERPSTPITPRPLRKNASPAEVAKKDQQLREYQVKKDEYDAYVNQRVNCGVDGYLMYRPVPGAADVSTLAADYLQQPLEVEANGTRVTLKTLNNLVMRSPDIDDAANNARADQFENDNKGWKMNFKKLCNRGGGLGSIEWGSYGEELSGATDWYYLYDQSWVDSDGKNQRDMGHLFLQLLDTPEMKAGKHMPSAGEFAERYLYIGLVCAKGTGLGKYLMNIAYAASRALGCTGIALATMSNSAGFYYGSQKFAFMDKDTGTRIDVSRYVVPEMGSDGTMRPTLQINYDPDEPEARGQKRSADEAALDDAAAAAQSIAARLSYFF